MRKAIAAAVVGASLVLALIAVGTACGICAYSQRSETAQADAAIVLGAAAWGDQPSPVFRERINHAIDLYREGYVRKLILTGGTRSADDLPEAIVARRYALARGVPATDILVETRSRITEENLLQGRQVAAEERLSRFLIVSDPLHMKRAMLIAIDLGMDAHPSPTPTTLYRSLPRRCEFLARETFFYLAYLVARPFRGAPQKPCEGSSSRRNDGRPGFVTSLPWERAREPSQG